jgi:hypothetical protein
MTCTSPRPLRRPQIDAFDRISARPARATDIIVDPARRFVSQSAGVSGHTRIAVGGHEEQPSSMGECYFALVLLAGIVWSNRGQEGVYPSRR